MRTLATMIAGACAFALATGPVARTAPPSTTPLQVADMDMGPNGPQLGGSSDDMVLTNPGFQPAPAGDMITVDPGHVPAEAQMVADDPGTNLAPASDMVTSDPGFVPAPAQMDLGTPQDDDTQDDITQ
jgi:hypothetical protein